MDQIAISSRLSGAKAWLVARVRRLGRFGVFRSITPIGWTLLLGGAAVAWLGWMQGWLEFLALGTMAVVVMVVAGLWILRRREHDVLLELRRPRVQAGDEAIGRVLITAGVGKTSGPTTMEFPVGKAVATFRVGALAPADQHEEMFTIPARRRGIVALGPVRSVQSDPIGAVSRSKQLTEMTELYIHPRVIHVEAGAIGLLKDVEGTTTTTNLSSSDVSFHALREYIPGDDRRAVHWRTTARTGRLMVRQFEETMRAHLVLMLSTIGSDYETPEDFELAVSALGSLGVSALRAERQVSVLTSTGELAFCTPLGLLDRLAGVELGAKGRDRRSIATQVARMPGASVGAFFTGASSLTTLRAAQLALPPSVYPFAVRCASSLSLSRRRVGDLIVLDIATLGELPVALRSLR